MNPQHNDQQLHIITPPTKSHKGKIVAIVFVALLIMALGAFSFLWWQERNQSHSLQSQLDAAKQQVPKLRAPATEETPTQAKYTASVGKFTLTLGGNYYIIVEKDGAGEGGSSTQLSIGTLSSQGEQIINSAPDSRVTIHAYPVEQLAYSDRIKQEIGDLAATDQKKLGNTTVAGVDTEVYELNSLQGHDKKLFFTKNNLIYIITAIDSEATQPVLDEVVKGFKFN